MKIPIFVRVSLIFDSAQGDNWGEIPIKKFQIPIQKDAIKEKNLEP